jgi:uncharacterized protein (TIGR03000 family)
MMRNVKAFLLFLVGCLCLVIGHLELRADDVSWVGKSVLTRHSDAQIHHNADGKDRVVALRGLKYRVEDQRDGWVKLRQGGETGWVDKEDVVPLESAVPFFTEQIRQNPGDLAAFNRRAWALHLQGQQDLAIREYTELIRVQPTAYLYSNRSHVWLTKRDYVRTVADCTEAIRLDPKYGKAYINRGAALKVLHQYSRALDDFNEAIRLDPRFDMAYYGRGRVWLATGEYAKAVDDFDEAIRLNPFNALAIKNRATALAMVPPTAQAPVTLTDTNVLVNVRVPASATVWVNGDALTRTGSRREFIASDLTPGKTYAFVIRAQWEEGGKTVDLTRKIAVQGGERRTVDFSASPPAP